MLRFLNHSCNPSALFHEVQTGDKVMVVAITIRHVYPGEQVAVSYGYELGFMCRRCWWGCQQRDIQDLPDILG
ncbi:SET domain [Phytophthora cactorum]|nr:SET domain [Phytophthora cactorum]